MNTISAEHIITVP